MPLAASDACNGQGLRYDVGGSLAPSDYLTYGMRRRWQWIHRLYVLYNLDRKTSWICHTFTVTWRMLTWCLYDTYTRLFRSLCSCRPVTLEFQPTTKQGIKTYMSIENFSLTISCISASSYMCRNSCYTMHTYIRTYMHKTIFQSRPGIEPDTTCMAGQCLRHSAIPIIIL